MSDKKIILFIVFLFLFSCKNKENSNTDFLKKYDTSDVLGFWKLIPSEKTTFILFEEDGNGKIFHDNIPEIIILKADSHGLRFFHTLNEDTPFGYFLFSEKNQDIWTGLYENNLVRIERVINKKKSILE